MVNAAALADVLVADDAPPDTAERLRGMVDELVVLATPEPFAAVGGFYVGFEQVSDDEVVDLLRRTAMERRAEA